MMCGDVLNERRGRVMYHSGIASNCRRGARPCTLSPCGCTADVAKRIAGGSERTLHVHNI